jgi:hypothetical protein
MGMTDLYAYIDSGQADIYLFLIVILALTFLIWERG